MKKNNNVKKVILKAAVTANTALCTLCCTMMSASAANSAPNGVDSNSYNTIIDIVMWIVIAAIGAAAIPALQGIVKGQTDNDMRERNSGIVGVVVAGCCIAAATVIRNICF